jgi:ParB family chromosome partitioning protein
MDEAAIAELADSIRSSGLLQPPTVRAVNEHYELAFGHRRWAARQSARPGEPMPVNVAVLDDKQMAVQAASENGQRADLNQIERAGNILSISGWPVALPNRCRQMVWR